MKQRFGAKTNHSAEEKKQLIAETRFQIDASIGYLKEILKGFADVKYDVTIDDIRYAALLEESKLLINIIPYKNKANKLINKKTQQWIKEFANKSGFTLLQFTEDEIVNRSKKVEGIVGAMWDEDWSDEDYKLHPNVFEIINSQERFTKEEIESFHEEFNIMGKGRTKAYLNTYAIYHKTNKEIVAMLTLSKTRVQNCSKKIIDIERYSIRPARRQVFLKTLLDEAVKDYKDSYDGILSFINHLNESSVERERYGFIEEKKRTSILERKSSDGNLYDDAGSKRMIYLFEE